LDQQTVKAIIKLIKAYENNQVQFKAQNNSTLVLCSWSKDSGIRDTKATPNRHVEDTFSLSFIGGTRFGNICVPVDKIDSLLHQLEAYLNSCKSD
jgi:hypothetical protein